MNDEKLLELPDLSNSVLSMEDKIFITLFREKSATKSDITKLNHGVLYSEVRNQVERMLAKGYLSPRYIKNDEEFYYLTAHGLLEMEYRLNTINYNKLYNVLLAKQYDEDNIVRFLANRYYNYYLNGEFDFESLDEQYTVWCQNNLLDYYAGPKKKLVK